MQYFISLIWCHISFIHNSQLCKTWCKIKCLFFFHVIILFYKLRKSKIIFLLILFNTFYNYLNSILGLIILLYTIIGRILATCIFGYFNDPACNNTTNVALHSLVNIYKYISLIYLLNIRLFLWELLKCLCLVILISSINILKVFSSFSISRNRLLQICPSWRIHLLY